MLHVKFSANREGSGRNTRVSGKVSRQEVSQVKVSPNPESV